MKLHQWGDIDYRGTIVRVDYSTADLQGNPRDKYANVYLPYQYDGNRPYNILYLMHGGGGNPDAWLDASQIKNVLDLAFARKLAEPFIVVFPTYYDLNPSEHRHEGVDASWEYAQVEHFQKELEKDLIPAIESRFSTFAGNTDHEGLKASRKHRAFGGFSMGACVVIGQHFGAGLTEGLHRHVGRRHRAGGEVDPLPFHTPAVPPLHPQALGCPA